MRFRAINSIVEYPAFNRKVIGSSPIWPTKEIMKKNKKKNKITGEVVVFNTHTGDDISRQPIEARLCDGEEPPEIEIIIFDGYFVTGAIYLPVSKLKKLLA